MSGDGSRHSEPLRDLVQVIDLFPGVGVPLTRVTRDYILSVLARVAASLQVASEAEGLLGWLQEHPDDFAANSTGGWNYLTPPAVVNGAPSLRSAIIAHRTWTRASKPR